MKTPQDVLGEAIAMLPADYQTLLTALIAASGAGIFLRITAREKHRREKWLQFRLEEKLNELRARQMQAQEGRAADEPITATPTRHAG